MWLERAKISLSLWVGCGFEGVKTPLSFWVGSGGRALNNSFGVNYTIKVEEKILCW